MSLQKQLSFSLRQRSSAVHNKEFSEALDKTERVILPFAVVTFGISIAILVSALFI